MHLRYFGFWLFCSFQGWAVGHSHAAETIKILMNRWRSVVARVFLYQIHPTSSAVRWNARWKTRLLNAFLMNLGSSKLQIFHPTYFRWWWAMMCMIPTQELLCFFLNWSLVDNTNLCLILLLVAVPITCIKDSEWLFDFRDRISLCSPGWPLTHRDLPSKFWD